jgi:uncharacterized metal-binding protein YceD (DUF177 family)
MTDAWDKPVKLHEVRGLLRLKLVPDEAQRAAIAKQLGLASLAALEADVTLKPWLDGVEVKGRFWATVEQVCGVSLDRFEQNVDGEIDARAVPQGSANAGGEDAAGEIELDLEAADPPDVFANDKIDVAGYVVEHLALEIDPFPRRPGATFDYKPPEDDVSPFAALKKLKDPKP